MDCYEVEIIKDGRYVYIIIPFNTKEVFNRPKGTIYISGTINDIPYRSKLISRGNGVQIIIIDRKLQKVLGFCGTSMNVQMTITEDNIVTYVSESQNLIKNCSLNILSCISTRRSIRGYTNQPIAEEQMNTILDAGFCAPSAQNKRPWHFIIIRNKGQLFSLSETNIKGEMIQHSNCCIVVCGDRILQGINELLIEDCSAATQNILLAAHGLGIGAVWCGIVQNSDWKKHIITQLKLPESIIPIAVISLGYPDEIKTAKNRFELSKVHNEVW
ncbi:nitroreductase family protein [Clostridium estertheticum]|uniref:nitroreductase family protein n=1 Tax=Clostridium estertheticum TaxID=238834 RepID=UPI0013E946E4|nr:nitroreductase family protein [Clostridium estertheticum]MBZ9687326.1 nitroreductase family protein [Clostridium estertheticum]